MRWHGKLGTLFEPDYSVGSRAGFSAFVTSVQQRCRKGQERRNEVGCVASSTTRDGASELYSCGPSFVPGSRGVGIDRERRR